MKITLLLLLLAVGAFVAFALWVRFAPSDPGRWHVDPASAPDPSRPNFARADRVVPMPPDEARDRFHAIATGKGAELLAGDDQLATYVARTRRMRFPDYLSLRFDPAEGGGTRIQALSRARFGRGDMGVNAARLRRWLDRLAE
ncbi:DUF1499 domain-containing protein [Pararhodobacter sp. SW119]|uniref:DUF1499 domain-containing protein n=1 Tax=Pararhodobacter sp. SW119 TaxID=2780075 RepID=UPI001ADFD784|nr:DUF1499 domain-containing protein [Pararhodobacter sp. SW119]